ncbi:MAG: DUF6364 family protein [Flavobacteriaceae bacterium]
MNTKLTLNIDKDVIEKAKEYASKKKTSISSLIENYLNSLTKKEKKEDESEISPFVKSMSSGKSVPLDIDYKKEYYNYLSEKHQ